MKSPLRVLAILFVFLPISCMASDGLYICEDQYQSARNFLLSEFGGHFDSETMSEDLKERILKKSEKANDMFLEVETCYAKNKLVTEGSERYQNYINRRNWTKRFGNFARFISAVAVKVSDPACERGCELSFEYEYLKEMVSGLM